MNKQICYYVFEMTSPYKEREAALYRVIQICVYWKNNNLLLSKDDAKCVGGSNKGCVKCES